MGSRNGGIRKLEMKKSGIVDAGAGNANENGGTAEAGAVLAGPLRELPAGAGGCPPVPGARCRRLAGRARQFGCTRRRWRPRRPPACRAGRGWHFAFETAGRWRGAGGAVTVTTVVVTVVVGVGLTALLGAAGSVGLATMVVAVSAATAPAPSRSAAHHASVDVPPLRSTRTIALRLTATAPSPPHDGLTPASRSPDVLFSASSSWDRPSHLIVTPRSRPTPHFCPLGQPLDLNVLSAG
jgi:hypothetical protein